MATIHCNEIAQVSLELKMKFQNCTTLNADDLDKLIDLVNAISTCVIVGAITIPQSDWNEVIITDPSYIQNKPNIITPVQSDWNQTTITDLSYINNKPSLGGPTNNYQSITTKIGEITLQAGVYDIHRIMIDITNKVGAELLFSEPEKILGNGATGEEIIMVTDIRLLVNENRVLTHPNLIHNNTTNTLELTTAINIGEAITKVYLVFEYAKKSTFH